MRSVAFCFALVAACGGSEPTAEDLADGDLCGQLDAWTGNNCDTDDAGCVIVDCWPDCETHLVSEEALARARGDCSGGHPACVLFCGSYMWTQEGPGAWCDDSEEPSLAISCAWSGSK